jgi:hypothetical protein
MVALSGSSTLQDCNNPTERSSSSLASCNDCRIDTRFVRSRQQGG